MLGIEWNWTERGEAIQNSIGMENEDVNVWKELKKRVKHQVEFSLASKRQQQQVPLAMANGNVYPAILI